jgi:hypothetical protein
MANVEVPLPTAKTTLGASGWPTPKLPALTGDDDDDIFGKGILNVAIRAIIGELPSQGDRNGYLGIFNLVRLTDKSINEYLAAYEACTDFDTHKNEGRISPYFRAIDNFESCINSLFRATRHAQRLRPRIKTDKLDSADWKAVRNAQSRLKGLRNTIEHTEEELAKGTITDEKLGMLWLYENHLAMVDCQINYADLVMWINRMYKVTTALRTA